MSSGVLVNKRSTQELDNFLDDSTNSQSAKAKRKSKKSEVAPRKSEMVPKRSTTTPSLGVEKEKEKKKSTITKETTATKEILSEEQPSPNEHAAPPASEEASAPRAGEEATAAAPQAAEEARALLATEEARAPPKEKAPLSLDSVTLETDARVKSQAQAETPKQPANVGPAVEPVASEGPATETSAASNVATSKTTVEPQAEPVGEIQTARQEKPIREAPRDRDPFLPAKLGKSHEGDPEETEEAKEARERRRRLWEKEPAEPEEMWHGIPMSEWHRKAQVCGSAVLTLFSVLLILTPIYLSMAHPGMENADWVSFGCVCTLSCILFTVAMRSWPKQEAQPKEKEDSATAGEPEPLKEEP